MVKHGWYSYKRRQSSQGMKYLQKDIQIDLYVLFFTQLFSVISYVIRKPHDVTIYAVKHKDQLLHTHKFMNKQTKKHTNKKTHTVAVAFDDENTEPEEQKNLNVALNNYYETSHKLSELSAKHDVCRSDLQSQTDLAHHVTSLYYEEKEKYENKTYELQESRDELRVLGSQFNHQVTLIDVIRGKLDLCITNQMLGHCEFEDERICGFSQDYLDNVDWIWSNSRNNTKYAPHVDHTCESRNGHFLVVNITTKENGQKARLISPHLFGYEEQCVEFFYWIHGSRDVGYLNVIAKIPDTNEEDNLWRASGNQGNVWIQAKVNVQKEFVRAGYKLIFEATIGRGLTGEIAIDDFKITNGVCSYK
ncbi:hypothetical protein HELRODRAFT_174638 [Helobdella robusta]|uniref:MAM domain-containing protein n=1 Tax=Helobdella robusta TaxID=6412 RepID=T1F8C0_HELRO|nr:hypothetical protein HELRODRAFT_174638 [Helobdella robusta]ESO01676.1 hypothetical protein HELRODRAFT_174638 [Helobdella robusta]